MPRDLPPRAQELVERIPEIMQRGTVQNRVTVAATDLALSKGVPLYSDEHFDIIERELESISSDGSIVLDEEQRKTAKDLGLSEAEYLEGVAELNNRKRQGYYSA